MAGKRRLIRLHTKLSLLVALVVTLVIAFLVFKKSAVLPNRLSKFVNQHYLKGTPFRFSCGKISGNFISNISLEHPSLKYRGPDFEFEFFSADRIVVEYSILPVIRFHMAIRNLSIDGASLFLRRNEEGRFITPLPLVEAQAEAARFSPVIDVERFSIKGFDLVFRSVGGEAVVSGADLEGALRFEEGQGRIEVENARGFIGGRRTAVRSLRANVAFSKAGVSIENFVVRLDSSYIMASGRYENGEAHGLRLIFNPLDLAEVSHLGITPPGEGEIGGSISFDGKLDSLTMKGSVTGRALGMTFRSLSFEGCRTRSGVRLSRLEGKVFGSYVNGEMTYASGARGGYSFSGTCSDLDISSGFLPYGNVPETDLCGQVDLHYTRNNDTYTIEAHLDTSSLKGFESDRIEFRGRWTGTSGLAIESMEFSRPGFVIDASGTIDTRSRTDLIFDIRGGYLDYLWDYLSLPRVRCELSINGRIVGPTDNLRMNLSGGFKNASFLFASIDSGAVQAELRNIPGEELSSRIDLQGREIEIAGKKFRSPHILLEAGAGRVAFRDFSFAKGDTLVTTDFDVTPVADFQKIRFKHISVKTSTEAWNLQRIANLTVQDGSIGVDSLVLGSDSRIFGLAGDYSSRQGVCSFSAWADGVELGLLQRFFALPLDVEGKAKFKVNVEGSVEKPLMGFSFMCEDGSIGEIGFDKFYLDGGYSDSGYVLDSLLVIIERDSLYGKGWWEHFTPPLNLSRGGIDRDRAVGSPLGLRLQARHFPLGTLFRALGKESPVGGDLTGEVLITGKVGDLKISFDGSLSPGEEAKFRFPHISCDLFYEHELLSVRSLSVDDGKLKGEIHGYLPVVLDMGGGFKLREGAPMEWNISISARDLSGLAAYFDGIALAAGRCDGSISVRGSMGKPTVSGKLDFHDCAVRLSGMEEVYENLGARLVFMDSLVQLASLNGKVGKDGSFYGSGYLELSGFKPRKYRLDIFLNDFLLSSIPDFLSLLDGNLTIASRDGGEKRLVPALTGSLKVKQAQLTYLFGEGESTPTPLKMPVESPGWYCDIDIDAPKNVWVKNPGLRMELGGRVILKRDQRGLYLRGTLSVLRGSYTIYNNKFRITEGDFDFSAATALRPEMRISAYTPYRREGDREHRIFLSLSWPKDKKEPQVTLSYDEPGYSETDVWKMLGGTYVSQEEGTEVGSSWDAVGTARDIASNYLETILNAQMKDITIDVESRMLKGTGSVGGGDQEMSIAIGRYLSEDLYLKYRQGLSITTEREVDIEYRIGHMFILRSEIIRHSEKHLLGKSKQATDEINLDIKFRFEY